MDLLDIPVQLIRGNMKKLFLLTGLDASNDRFHADISAVFLQNTDPTAKYELLSPQHQIFNRSEKAVLKPNVGILRIAWVDKYTLRRPAVVLIFVDLEWDDPNFAEKKTECESKINSLRQTINSAEVKFLLILIQKRPITASSAFTDRANELCTTCNIKREQILPLAVSEGIKPAIVTNIKKIVGDFSQQFYQAVHKKIRLRRVPENYTNLLIRNQFKLGYISEIRSDLASALNFYKLAFDKYTEAKISDEDKFEYLSVASVINYKICEIYFHRGNAIEAVTQFNRHEDKFMNRSKFNPGAYPSELLAQIEYAKWCMKEYATFGHLFVEAANAVVLNTSVNPGKYFNSAGEFSEISNGLIKHLKSRLTPDSVNVPIDILTLKGPLEFLGQRPWRPNVSLADGSTEHRARLALEKTVAVDYEQSIIYFKRALVYLRKVEKCSRQIRVAELQLATVLAHQKNFEGSLAIAEGAFRMMKDGIGLCHSIYILLYELYFALCEPVKLLQIVIQMMHPGVMRSTSCKRIFGLEEDSAAHFLVCFNNICNQTPPPLLPSVLTMLDSQERSKLMEKWQNQLNQKLRVDMTMLDGAISARGFIQSSVDVISDEADAICQVKVENQFGEPFPINKANFVFEIFSPVVTPHNPVHFFSYTTQGFTLEPKDFSLFCFPLNPVAASFSGGCEVTLSVIELYVGHDFCLSFDNRHYNYSKFSSLGPIQYRESVRIIRSEYPISLTRVDADNDEILKDEIRPLSFTVENCGSLVLSGISFTFKAIDINGQETSKDVALFDDEVECKPTITKQVPDNLNPGEQLTVSVNVSFLTAGEKNLTVEVAALLHTVDPSPFKKSIPIVFDVGHSFEPLVKSINNEPAVVDYFLEGVDTKLEVHLKAATDCVINGYQFQMTHGISGDCTETSEAFLKGNESHVVSTLCSPDKVVGASEMPIGQVVIQWKRGQSLKEVTTVYDLGKISIIKAPIALSVDLGRGSDHVIYKVIPVTFTLTNLLKIPLTLKLSVLRSDVFMFAGTNEIPFSLESGQTQQKNFAFVANVVGELPFPKVQLECPQDTQNTIENYVLKSMPKNILVLPASKSSDVQSPSKTDRYG